MKISEAFAEFIREYPVCFYLLVFFLILETGQTIRAFKVTADVAVVSSR